MKFENTFAVDAPIDEVYATLLDVERVAPCVPGAEVLEKTGDNAYQVAIKVRVGPISMTYRGNVEIVERDDENHRAVMRARARETRGQGTADARVDLSLVQEGETTKGTMVAEVQLAGRAAAMGRGVIQDVSAKIVSTFSENLEQMLGGGGPAVEPAPEPQATGPEGPPAEAAAAAAPAARAGAGGPARRGGCRRRAGDRRGGGRWARGRRRDRPAAARHRRRADASVAAPAAASAARRGERAAGWPDRRIGARRAAQGPQGAWR